MARVVAREARWQASTALLVLGPALGFFGWAAAFTVVGAGAIFLGMALSTIGWLVRPTRWTFGFALAGLFVEVGWIIVFSLLAALWGGFTGLLQ